MKGLSKLICLAPKLLFLWKQWCPFFQVLLKFLYVSIRGYFQNLVICSKLEQIINPNIALIQI